MSELSKDFDIPSVASASKEGQENRRLRVTFLSSEWRSSADGDLSTINRELAIQLAKHSNVEVSVFLPQCSEEDKDNAASHGVQLIVAEMLPGMNPVDCLMFVPDGHVMDWVVGHGVALGKQVQVIRKLRHCKWIQVVHTVPEELGMYKCISQGEQLQKTEVVLCEKADQVVAIGPKLTDAYKRYLRCSQKEQIVFDLTPSIFSEFLDVKQATEERRTFSVLVIGSDDSCEDFILKGYDLAAQAIAELKDKSYQLKFVGVPRGKGDEIADKLLQHGIDRSQLIVCSFSDSREVLANLFCEADLAIMPSKTEGFGLRALEALSAGLPVLVSGNSGLGEALKEVPLGSQYVIDPEDPKDWAREIKAVRQKKRSVRLAETKFLREKYLEMYSWEEPIRSLVERMCSLIFGSSGVYPSHSPVEYGQCPFPSASVTEKKSVQQRGPVQEQVPPLTKSEEPAITSQCPESPSLPDYPEQLVELIRREYKGAVLCPFPWCEDELQFELSKIFTRLMIVARKKERAKLTKDLVRMTDVFRPLKKCYCKSQCKCKREKPRVVLIEGPPGMGKTTYCQKLAYDWSVEDITTESFPNVNMLLRLTCRDMKTANIEDAIDDQLLPVNVDKKDKEKFFHFIRYNQNRILLVLDGLDELPKNLFEEFLPLIKGRVFPLTYVMLTARHEAGMKVRRYCDALFEIVGYTEEDAYNYIVKYFSNHEKPRLAMKLIEEINRDSQLKELTANALNTALLCLVFEDTGGILPHNKTTLYCELVNCVLRRYCSKKEISLDYQDPVEKYTDQLNQLGELALEALLEDQLAFTLEELKSPSTEFLELGFLSREASASKIRPKPTYAFIHKTFQEYFAAFHLAHGLLTTDRDKAALLAQLSPVAKYWQVWEFLITTAASKNDDTAVSVVSSICAAFQHQKSDQFFNRRYAQQAEDSDDQWSKGYRNSLLLERALIQSRWGDENYHKGDTEETATMPFYLNASTLEEDSDDEWCKGYRNSLLLERASLQSRWGDENYHKDDIEETVTMPFYLSASAQEEDSDDEWSEGYRSSLLLGRALPQRRRGDENYHKDDDTEETATMLFYLNAYALEEDSDPYRGFLSSLSPEYKGVICKDAEYEWESEPVKWSSFRNNAEFSFLMTIFYTIAQCEYPYSGLKPRQIKMASTLARYFPMDDIRVICSRYDTTLDSVIPFVVSEYLKGNCKLNKLAWGFDVSAAAALVDVLQTSHTLSHLHLKSGSSITSLTPALQENHTITHLNMRETGVGDVEAKALGKVLQSNNTLTHLCVAKNKITPIGVEAIAEALKSNKVLENLNIGMNCIGDKGAVALSHALKSNQTLRCLNLDGRLNHLNMGSSVQQIGDQGLRALAHALRYNNSLTYIDLHGHNFSDSSLTELGKTLQSNCSLTHLYLRCVNVSLCSKSRFGAASAVAFSKALQSRYTQLTRLDLSRYSISSSCVIILAEALRVNGTLKRFDLSLNRTDCPGAVALAQALKTNQTLTHLQLKHNKIGDDGAKEFVKVLQYNKTLMFLDLLGNLMTKSGKDLFKVLGGRLELGGCGGVIWIRNS